MINLADYAKTKPYSSLELEDNISSVLEMFENDQVFIALEPVKNYLQVHWASQTAVDLLNGLEQVLLTLGQFEVQLRVDFVPPEFETTMLEVGFAPHSEYIECWLDDL